MIRVLVAAIPESVRKLWKDWNIRSIVLFSLGLQTFLILAAPTRKRTSSKPLIFLLWTAYLLADWAANFAVGHISSRQNDDSGSGTKSFEQHQSDVLQAFWAPFLLLHLGGPDTISAFALEDNELWLRHLLGLVTQVLATAYVFIQTVPDNILWRPTLLMFLGGIIKYSERTRSLYLASLNSFRESLLESPDPGPNYAKLMEEFSSNKNARLPTVIQMTPEPGLDAVAISTDKKLGDLDEIEIVTYAHDYFKIFKGLIVDSIFSFRERKQSRDFFTLRTANEAFRVMEVELNFIYDALFTKVVVVRSTMGYIFRVIALASVVIALGLFYKADKDGLTEFDKAVTYMLLYGAIFLDAVALIMLFFSDWTVVGLQKHFKEWYALWLKSLFRGFLKLQRPSWHEIGKKFNIAGYCLGQCRKALYKRWSESIMGYNFIEYCLKENPDVIFDDSNKHSHLFYVYYKIRHLCRLLNKSVKWLNNCVIEYFGAKNLIDELKYVYSIHLTKELWNFIFQELLWKADDADDAETARRIREARGTYVLQEQRWNGDVKKLLPYIEDVTFDESLLLWHIATELCYQDEEDDTGKSKRELKKYLEDTKIRNVSRKFSKILSDYLLYLLNFQPTMMSAVAGIGQIRFRDTSAEAKNFFIRKNLGPGRQKSACMKIIEVDTNVKPVTVKGDRSKSVLFDACLLAKELMKFEKEEKWELVSKVWVEMMSYAASHSRPETHVQQVSKGGELVTFVWLLMAHFGIGDQFQISEGHARAKLIVSK